MLFCLVCFVVILRFLLKFLGVLGCLLECVLLDVSRGFLWFSTKAKGLELILV